MKIIKNQYIPILLSVCVFLSLNLFSHNSIADNNDKCAIWLCLPMGFPEGCSGAKHEMINRIKHFKSPLPSLSGCLANDSESEIAEIKSKLGSADGIAAYIPEYTSCEKWAFRPSGRNYPEKVCLNYVTHGRKMIKDKRCYPARGMQGNVLPSSPQSKPAYCTRTLNYVEVYIDGEQSGDTYYFDNNGEGI